MNNYCDVGEMVCLPETNDPRVLIIGGGVAGLALAKALKKTQVQVVLVDRHNFHQFQPLFYQVATSGLEADSIVFPFRKQISGHRNTIFRYASVEQINADKSQLLTDKGIIDYDYLVIATGTKTNFFGMSDIENWSLGMKSIQDSLNIRHLMILNLEQAAITCDEQEKDILTNFIIVGGGPAGVEMAGALAEFKKYVLPGDYPEYSSQIMDIYLLEAGDQLLATMSGKASEKALKYLTQLGVKVMLHEAVEHYDGTMVSTNSGNTLYARNLIWTAGVTGSFPEGIDQESIAGGNRLQVDHTMRVKGYSSIFAIGDIAAIITEKTPKGHPQVAQVAIQQGKYLGKVIQNKIAGKEESPQPFKYRDKGSLATIGKRRAVADLGKFRFGGYLAWLLWSVVHLFSISGFRNKLMVALNWVWNYFTYDKGNRLIIRNYKKKVLENEDSL
ncbi:MAG: NAD(P)/FAD-dependent oxidoreductase [Cyclobacteriaceae bacterium]